MRRSRRRVKPKRRTRRNPKALARLDAQQPVTKADATRLGQYARERARPDNLKRIRKAMIRARDGQVYYRGPHGWVKTSGEVVELPDGTLRPLPPAPRPSKRDRAKMKRRAKREAV